jgi:hypothetical protein
MSVKIGSYLFEGSYQAPGDLRNKPGIFLVTEYLKGKHTILDIGESDEVRKAVEFNNRRECWLKNSVKYELRVNVLYTPDLTVAQRKALEKQFRAKLKPPCGPAVKSKRAAKPKKRRSVKPKVAVRKKSTKRSK